MLEHEEKTLRAACELVHSALVLKSKVLSERNSGLPENARRLPDKISQLHEAVHEYQRRHL